MKQTQSYLKNTFENPVPAIVKGIDHDVERGEDILMLGLACVMMSTFFAPIAPPPVLMPAVALIFCVSVTFARLNYQRMEQKLKVSSAALDEYQATLLKPIAHVFSENPVMSLTDSFNPLKNLTRTGKSFLGGLLINPFWMPIFYVMGIQINEEKNLGTLNQAIIGVEKRIFPPRTKE